ncbi:MAG: hypothetical protein Q4E83_02140 [bacterium]|nr:hypothetical protein [bacterium]
MKIISINKNINTKSNNRNLLLKKSNVFNNKSINFKGQRYSFGYFTDKEITDTYRYMKYSDSDWRAIAESDFISECSFFKYVFGNGAEEIKDHLDEMAKLRTGLKNQERQDALKKQEMQRLAKKLEEKRIKEIETAKKRKIMEKAKMEFLDCFMTFVELEQNGNEVQIPNGMLIEKTNSEYVKNFLDWTKSSTNYYLKTLEYPNSILYPLTQNHQDNFLDQLSIMLKESKADYIKNNKRTVLHISNFEYLGKETLSNKQIIATMKSLMQSCSNKYMCTILIDIAKEKIKDIDPILLVDSRIQIKIKL